MLFIRNYESWCSVNFNVGDLCFLKYLIVFVIFVYNVLVGLIIIWFFFFLEVDGFFIWFFLVDLSC